MVDTFHKLECSSNSSRRTSGWRAVAHEFAHAEDEHLSASQLQY
jgi:hypothetical protein